jgi:hypothetical protein
MAALIVQMELDTHGFLTIDQVQDDLKQLLGKKLITVDIDTKSSDGEYPILYASLLIEIEFRETTREAAAVFAKLHKLYDHIDGIIQIVCGEYSGLAGKRSFQKENGGQLFLT